MPMLRLCGGSVTIELPSIAMSPWVGVSNPAINNVPVTSMGANAFVSGPGDDAIMRKDGNKLIIEAVAPRSLIALLATLEPLGEGFPAIPDETPDAVEI